MQAEQAQQQAQQPQGQPQPGQMPGMAGAPGVQGGVPMPPPGQGALSSILSNLRKPAAQSGPEQADGAVRSVTVGTVSTEARRDAARIAIEGRY